jgi:ribulose-phosphate 3-epimerase
MEVKMTILAPSLLSADFSCLGAELESVKKSGADWLHFDVMDGNFVPNLSFGAPVLKSIRPGSALPFDVHLMVNHPETYIGDFVKAGADWITFHQEACVHSQRLIEAIHTAGKKAGISIVPGTPVSALESILPFVDLVLVMTVNPGFGGQKLIPQCLQKVSALRDERRERGLHFLLSVDGGIDEETGPAAVTAGSDILVTGSAFFKKKDRAAYVKALKGLSSRLV